MAFQPQLRVTSGLPVIRPELRKLGPSKARMPDDWLGDDEFHCRPRVARQGTRTTKNLRGSLRQPHAFAPIPTGLPTSQWQRFRRADHSVSRGIGQGSTSTPAAPESVSIDEYNSASAGTMPARFSAAMIHPSFANNIPIETSAYIGPAWPNRAGQRAGTATERDEIGSRKQKTTARSPSAVARSKPQAGAPHLQT